MKGCTKWDSLSFHRILDSAVLWLARRQIRLLGGEYGPEALIPLHQALDSLRSEISAALRTIGTEVEVLGAFAKPNADDCNFPEEKFRLKLMT